jgi:hypothetical protein
VNEGRPKFPSLLGDDELDVIAAEYRDRATRFGLGSIQTLLARSGRCIEVVNEAENDKEELMQDLIAIITAFVARYYGRWMARCKTEKLIEELKRTGNLGRAARDQNSDPRFEAIDAAVFAAKNRYNLENTTIQQSWLFGGGYIPFAQRYHLLKGTAAYPALPRKVSQQVLIQLDHNWGSFFASPRSWRETPQQFLGRPRPPRHKHKSRVVCC